MTIIPLRPRWATTSLALTGALFVGACGADDTSNSARSVTEPIVATYDGGIYVLDGTTLDVVEDIPKDGFLRLNPAGDDRHVLVSTATGFTVLDAASARLTDTEFPAKKPGHVVTHGGTTALFADGSGEVTTFDPAALGDGLPPTTVRTTEKPHHGVAVELAGGTLVTTLGDADSRPGIVAFDKAGNEFARNENCPGVHGEATAQGEAVVIGCETGALIYSGGTISKIDSPTPYGRIGNQAGSDASPITLGDYKQDKDAELERPQQVSLIDTRARTLRLVDTGASYSFRSLARGPEGKALVLGTDGALRVIDPVSGTITDTFPVVDAWQEPLEWQQARPALFVRGDTAYVTDPAGKSIHAVNLGTGEKTATATLTNAPNEISGPRS